MGGSAEYQSFMLVVSILLGSVALLSAIVLPVILRRRRRRAQQELHDKIEKAKADILEDGVVEGPKGPYVRHKPWGVGTELPPSNETGPPKGNAFHGGPWA